MSTITTTIEKIYRTTKKKDGSPLVNKNGERYERVGIQVPEYPGKWLNGFGGEDTDDWDKGSRVSITVEENGEYLNFRAPKRADALEERLRSLEDRVAALEGGGTAF